MLSYIVLPSFTSRKQFAKGGSKLNTCQLAHVRIHVECVIGQLRKKYKILQGTLPITRPSDPEPTIDCILVATSALVNLLSSVV